MDCQVGGVPPLPQEFWNCFGEPGRSAEVPEYVTLTLCRLPLYKLAGTEYSSQAWFPIPAAARSERKSPAYTVAQNVPSIEMLTLIVVLGLFVSLAHP